MSRRYIIHTPESRAAHSQRMREMWRRKREQQPKTKKP